jgi:hypothetical protein
MYHDSGPIVRLPGVSSSTGRALGNHADGILGTCHGELRPVDLSIYVSGACATLWLITFVQARGYPPLVCRPDAEAAEIGALRALDLLLSLCYAVH